MSAYSLVKLQARLKEFSIQLAEKPSMIDICQAVFTAFNLHPTEFSYNPSKFKEIGHTSMSVGDYIAFYDDEREETDVLICAPAGWKSLPCSFDAFVTERDRVIEKMYNMPVDVLAAMHTAILCDNFGEGEFYRILKQFTDKRCENLCPDCHSGKINWQDADIQNSKISQGGKCQECGHFFTEISEYVRTERDKVTNAEIDKEKNE
jgi:hypothetical protein